MRKVLYFKSASQDFIDKDNWIKQRGSSTDPWFQGIQNSEDYIIKEHLFSKLFMGTAQPQNASTQFNKQALSSYSQQELRVLEWRSSPQYNQFIPKVFFVYQQTTKTGSFISQCQLNQNLPVAVKYQTFIGSISLLYKKLSFQECLYALKSLLSGFQIILSYFGKAIVEPHFCFLTKQGEVKAWIHQDYRRNCFQSDKSDTDKSILDSNKLFLNLQKWIDHNKPSSSPANIIQKILFLASELTNQQKQFNVFIQKLDGFITGNMQISIQSRLKNFNFDRINKFINKYIYQNRIFVKYNLLEAIQRLYYQNLQQKYSQQRPIALRDSHLEGRSSQMSVISEAKEQSTAQTSSPILRKSVSAGKTDFTQQLKFVKKSEFFNSTAYSNTNASTKCNQFAQSNAFSLYREPLYRTYGSSEISEHPFDKVMQLKPQFNRNFIRPQFSMSYSTVTAKIPISDKKLINVQPSQKSSFISNKSEVKNKNVEFKMRQIELKPIPERKQSEPEEKLQVPIKQRGDFIRTSILMNRINQEPVGQSFSKITSQKMAIRTANIVQANKTSNVSIGLKAQDNRNSQNGNLKLFKSNCDNNEKQNRKKALFSTGFKTPEQRQPSNASRQQVINNIFTMKTLTRLISSNDNISQQQQSEGEFPSKENISSYSGILASMGRSVQILDIPDAEKLDFRTAKKQKTMFVSNPNCSNTCIFKSYDKFQKKMI